MSGRSVLWPGQDYDPDPAPPPGDRAVPDEGALAERLTEAVAAADAPDVVFALSRAGRRLVRCGGTAPPPALPRQDLRYEIGSATKSFTGLLLTELIRRGVLTGGERAAVLLSAENVAQASRATPAHLVTHTAGLPGLPRDFYRRGLTAWTTNPYARYPAERVVDAFLRYRPRREPGTHWHYSNFGFAVLGHVLGAATGVPWEDLVVEHLLGPLGLTGTSLRPGDTDLDATGRRKDGVTPTPAFDPGGFQAAGAVRSTPHDLLTFLEAHLRPGDTPLAGALRSVRRPVLRRGRGHLEEDTVSWFRHPTGGGPLYFHSGATLGQQAFLGFRPDVGTALVAVCTRRYRARDPFVATAYGLLADL
ncbi:serine hydrolase domain-containing protein [Streptomyces longwoodensis]|uniref:serine hydrolase domain-containing protein n=1 Tax=Streptomyces longwoodensis TaxID=68231 RepID=UPI003802D0D4